jgi:hypothetical protein
MSNTRIDSPGIRILRIAIVLVAVVCALAMTFDGGMGRTQLILLWFICGGVVGLIGGIRVLIIVGAMIAGAWGAGEFAHWYYRGRSGEAGISADVNTILLIMPGAAVTCGLVAALATRRLKKRPVT